MTNTQHTPGPWNIVEEQWKSSIEYYQDDVQICTVSHDGEGKANARLIAASPTLYKYALDQAKNGCPKAKEMLASLNITNEA